MKTTTFTFLLILSCFQMFHAQNFERFDVPVEINGETLLNPWAGGLNAPQWSSVDLNNDGVLDLYVFDRIGNIHLTWLNTDEAGEVNYEYVPAYADNFPSCSDFVLLRDYNNDDIMDLFTANGTPLIRVFMGFYQNNQLTFETVEISEQSSAIWQSGGIPAIDDLDNDGDIDLLTHVTGPGTTGTITYYKNQSVEMGYPLDSLVYTLEDNCWGKVSFPEDYQGLCLSLDSLECSYDCTHLNIAILATFDEDNDGDKELLFGNSSYNFLIKGENGGNANYAWITGQDNNFPSYDTPVNFNSAAPFYLDIDNDGLKDLMVSPNEDGWSPNQETAWFYKNVQSNEFPLFELQQKDFLVEDMIDMGTGAHPTFVDYNADGLMDIVVGNQSRWQEGTEEDAFLWLFENIGTGTEPVFELVDTNWLNFQQYSSVTDFFAPTFGDLDNDDDLDLLVGNRSGILFFVENIAGAGNPMMFGEIEPVWQGINVGQHATPFIHDVNQDGLPDLLIGERTGNVNYLPNQGTPGNPVFHPDPDEAPNNNNFGEIETLGPHPTIGYSAPIVLTCDDSIYIITGSETGYLEMYLVNSDSLDGGAFEVITEAMDSLRTGWRTRVAFADLNNDGFMEAVIGNQRGGMDLFTTDMEMGCFVSSVDAVQGKQLKLFPNPASDHLTILLPKSTFESYDVQVFDHHGRLVMRQFFTEGQMLQIGHLPNGYYLLKLPNGEEVYVGKFIKQ